MYFLKILAAALKPRPSEHATRVGDYTFSYRKQDMGPLHHFTVKNAVSEYDARMQAERKMAELTKTEGALARSLRLILD